MATQEILDIDKNEQVIIDIRRDPVGLYFIYSSGVMAIVALLAAMFFAIRFRALPDVWQNHPVVGILWTAGITSGSSFAIATVFTICSLLIF